MVSSVTTRLAAPMLSFTRTFLLDFGIKARGSSWRVSSTSFKERLTRDLVVPVSHGQLVAKQWGPDDGQPVLVLHDWFDNAGSFDALVPFLKPEFKIVALDLPGHGLSSHLEPGSDYTGDRYVEDVAIAVDQFQWDVFSVVGHGMGAGIGYYLGLLYPDRVTRLVAMEGSFPASCVDQGVDVAELRSCWSGAVRHTEEEILRLLESRGVDVKSGAKLLMTRGCSRVADGRYVFNGDWKVGCARPRGVYPGVFHRDSPRFRNSMLVLRKDTEHLSLSRIDAVEAFLRFVGAERCSKFSFTSVPGGRNAHITNPETIAHYVNDFLCA